MPKANRKELRKSLFKKGSDAREDAKKKLKEKHDAIEAEKPPKRVAPKRYILFVGNLPYDITEEEITTHFKSCEPTSIRLRSNGICFLEFGGADAANRLHHALLFHHSSLRNRKINVEFSAGGGGNSSKRRDKIKEKNRNFQEELKERGKTEAPSRNNASHSRPAANITDADRKEAESSGINPARLAALRNRTN